MDKGKLFSIISIIGLSALIFSCQTQEKTFKIEGLKHVIIIGVDGMSPDGIQTANTPTLDKLIKEGASTLHARSVLPTSSSPNWASMLMGAGPEQHGVTSNAWRKDEFVLPTVVSDESGFFPSIFSLIRKNNTQVEMGAIYHWDGFGDLFDNNLVNYNISPKTEDETASLTSAYLKEKKPQFTFVHLDHVDHAGHAIGHGTPAYYASVEKADSLISDIISTLEEEGMMENTLVIVSADHGGVGNGHGGETLEEIEIPLIMYGKGIKKGYEIKVPVNIYDLPASAAFGMGIDLPLVWIGRPVKEAFEGFAAPELAYAPQKMVRQPVIYPVKDGFDPAGGLFIDSIPTLKIENPNDMGVIRYTLDGSVPSTKSPEYTEEVQLSKSTVVKAALFVGSKQASREVVGYFRVLNSGNGHGVKYACYETTEAAVLPDFSKLSPVSEGTAHEFNLDDVKLPRPEQIATVMEAYIEIKEAGKYTFYIASDDGSKLYLNGKELVDNDGDHGVIEKGASATLEPGKYPLRVEWFNAGGGMGLYTYYSGPNTPKQLIPADLLYLGKEL
ncbi:alkaline phosphatase family protein [Flammeovirgaceae bacterium SG7u.111]|nr:alkaline phosphatase family protein [Flammeovirgaceae bacterium SG7u.132]WPO36000.1 alkaline phosphatase family protein [Flammeovirgaceae bacterium SG7u.111]